MAAVRGETDGGGLALALSADFIVAVDDTVMWCAEVTMGQLLLAGGYQRLASLIGPSVARRMVMLGEPTPVTTIPAVADYIVADDQPDETAQRLATRFSRGPTRSYAAAKSVLKAWSAGAIAAADKRMLDLTIGLFHTEDSQQGLDALLATLARGEQPAIAPTRPASPSRATDTNPPLTRTLGMATSISRLYCGAAIMRRDVVPRYIVGRLSLSLVPSTLRTSRFDDRYRATAARPKECDDQPEPVSDRVGRHVPRRRRPAL